jgi:hypothetical protein
MTQAQQIQAVVDRMRNFFCDMRTGIPVGGVEFVSRELVLKWAKEIEDLLKEEK